MKLKYAVAVCAALVLMPLAVVHVVLRASLATLDGDIRPLGVVSPVTIDRDALGVPTIEAANRVDLAYGTGFVHGQDRFFQMDLSRRLAAGELSEVFGVAAVEQDKKARLFRFRHVARQALQQGTPEQRAVLEAYARGVNAGLASLRSRPWEYWLLRSVPAEWRPEDTILVSHAMWWDLQYSALQIEIVRQQINSRMRGPECGAGWKCSLTFLYPAATEWDAPNAAVGLVNAGPVGGAAGGAHEAAIDGVAAPKAAADGAAGGGDAGGSDGGAAVGGAAAGAGAIPSPDILNVRGVPAANGAPAAFVPGDASGDRGFGSNNWAVAGRLTSTGAALVANDMHLRSRVPTTWYRARLRVRGTDTQPAVDLNGVTLPGAPLLIAGSNGHIAWGFTDSYGNWFHVAKATCTSATSVQQEEILVHGQPSVHFAVRSGAAGVVYQTDPDEQACWFVSWLAQEPAATNINLMALERTASVAQALAVAPTLGIPHENFVSGDRDGHIGWAIAGRIPVDSGATRALGASTWTTAETHPHILDPEVGRIWTANARPTDDPEHQMAIGGIDSPVGAYYDLGARARQIRDDLLAIKARATPADMLRIQLDDRAEFLARWRTLLIDLLDAEALVNHPERAQLKELVTNWNARASVDSVGYRMVRAFHVQTLNSVWEMVLRALGIASGEDVPVPSQFEAALWHLVSERPLHMLASNYGDWREFLLVQADAAIADLQRTCPQLAHCTWGSRRPVQIRHPLSRSLPFLSALLDMPQIELPGDHDMPRVQDGPIGASERFAVSPGHEDQGYIHIPGGQSGHPLSPYYRAGFMDWAHGTPVPFLPGASQHRLTLQPE